MGRFRRHGQTHIVGRLGEGGLAKMVLVVDWLSGACGSRLAATPFMATGIGTDNDTTGGVTSLSIATRQRLWIKAGRRQAAQARHDHRQDGRGHALLNMPCTSDSMKGELPVSWSSSAGSTSPLAAGRARARRPRSLW